MKFLALTLCVTGSFSVAEEVSEFKGLIIQPSRIEVRSQPGSVTEFSVYLLSSEDVEISLILDDPYVISNERSNIILLSSKIAKYVRFTSVKPHSGKMYILNKSNSTFTEIAYSILPPKDFNQSINLNYYPNQNNVGLSYTIQNTHVNANGLSYSFNTFISVNTETKSVNPSIGFTLSW